MAKVLMPHFKIVCDLETSGSCPIRNGVISACFLIIDENYQVVDEFIRYVRPPELNRKFWSLEAEGVHGMSFEKVQTFMPNDRFCFELLCFLKKYFYNKPIPFICHANPKGWKSKDGSWNIVPWFDFIFLEWCFRKALFQNGDEMVWTMYKAIHPNYLISTVKMGQDAGYRSNSLKVWAERLKINLNHHEVNSDTYACLEVYKHLNERLKDGI